MTPDRVKQDVVVSLQYKLWLDDGTLLEESEADEPLVYLHGHNNIIPGLERELTGLLVGDHKKVVVRPSDAYGEYDPENVDEVDRKDLPSNFEPQEGMLLSVQDEDGHEFYAQIVEVSDDTVVLDFNHPMAGETLHFDVTVTGVREPTPEELDHGHVHTHGHHP